MMNMAWKSKSNNEEEANEDDIVVARKLQTPVSKQIAQSSVDPRKDLLRERERASFNSRELEVLLAGGVENVKLRKLVAETLTKDRVFGNKTSEKYSLRREELYRTTLEKYLEIPRVAREILAKIHGDGGGGGGGGGGGSSGGGATRSRSGNSGNGVNKSNNNKLIAIARVVREFIDEPGGLDLHLGMFIPTIQGQGTDEQKKYWLPKCVNLEIVGTYAQTELGHGTFIRGLETTCTYDVRKKEFIVHSPTLTATKWWPGGLGKTATHAIVMARLFVPSSSSSFASHSEPVFSDKGIHAFVVQIRSTKDHLPLPGVQCGDIGDKMGYNAVDNGFLRFDHVRVPKDAMLMGHSKVLDDGTYVPPPVKKAAYGTMVFVRSDIVMNAALYMKKAVTIALRYNLVRRQSNADSKNNNVETQVLDYQHSQRTLFPILASSFAFHTTSDCMRRMYFEFLKRSQSSEKDFDALPELHATSSGLKAFCSWKTKDAIESCRLTCGGHGYLANAGFGTTFASYAPNVTYEGDNNVLCLQTSRYLLKTMRALQAKLVTEFKLVGQMKYLSESGNTFTSTLGHEVGIRDEDALLRAYEHRAWRLCSQATARAGNLSVDEAMRLDMVSWIKVAKSHCALVVLANFFDGIHEAEKLKVSKETIAVLKRLATLHALCGVEDELGDWVEDGYLEAMQCQLVREEIAQLLQEMRPDAAALADSLGLDDYFLNSTLGARDGNVYENLFAAAQKAPFNSSHKPPGYDHLLWPRFNASNNSNTSNNNKGRSKL
ncbi:unnamed protein product [Bathycoccus prasinos]